MINNLRKKFFLPIPMIFSIVTYFFEPTAFAMSRGNQPCFYHTGYKPKVVFEDLVSGNKIWIGREGDLTEPYEYQEVFVEQREYSGCAVCYTLLSSYKNPFDKEIYDLKIVTTPTSEVQKFKTDVLWRKQGNTGQWSYWYANLTCQN